MIFFFMVSIKTLPLHLPIASEFSLVWMNKLISFPNSVNLTLLIDTPNCSQQIPSHLLMNEMHLLNSDSACSFTYREILASPKCSYYCWNWYLLSKDTNSYNSRNISEVYIIALITQNAHRKHSINSNYVLGKKKGNWIKSIPRIFDWEGYHYWTICNCKKCGKMIKTNQVFVKEMKTWQ